MKKLFFTLVAVLMATITNAQSITWNEEFGQEGVVISNSTELSFHSDYLHADFWLDADGHTLNFYVITTIPHSGSADHGSMQISLSSAVDSYYDHNQWNEPPHSYDPYPSDDYVIRSGTLDLGTQEHEFNLVAWAGFPLFNALPYMSAVGTFHP